MKSSLVLPLLLLGAAGHCGIALAQSPGAFSATGNMTTRYGHTATLLTNGKVLIVGGSPALGSLALGFNAMATAELYDPVSATFSATGNMTTPRFGHTASLLPDGRVLIAGGVTGLIALDSAELYDSTTGKFVSTGRMNAVHSCLTSTLLNNGKVLVVGCELGELAELYDPATGTFTPAGATTPCSPKPVLLPGGKVLLVQGAGVECNDDAYPGVEIYDPESGGFSSLAWTQWSYDVAATANLLPDGTVLMILQAVECDYGGQPLFYNPSTSDWRAGNTREYLCRPTGTVLSDGTVLITNGSGEPRAELYDSASRELLRTGDMNAVRALATATLLNDGTVLLAGGTNIAGGPFYNSSNTAELYHPGVVRPPPALFSVSPEGQGAILHASTHQLVSPDNPAAAGEVLEVYLTGLLEGSVIPPRVAIGGRLAEILYFGRAPGYDRLNQVNFRVPSGIAPGSAVSVRLNYLARPSNEVTLTIR